MFIATFGNILEVAANWCAACGNSTSIREPYKMLCYCRESTVHYSSGPFPRPGTRPCLDPTRTWIQSRPRPRPGCGLDSNLISDLDQDFFQTRIWTRSATRTAVQTPSVQTITGAPLFRISADFLLFGILALNCVCIYWQNFSGEFLCGSVTALQLDECIAVYSTTLKRSSVCFLKILKKCYLFPDVTVL